MRKDKYGVNERVTPLFFFQKNNEISFDTCLNVKKFAVFTEKSQKKSCLTQLIFWA